MVNADRAHVIRRFKELLGWAEYILESLTINQKYEIGKREMLEQMLAAPELTELRGLAGSLRERLDRTTTRLESPRG